MTDPDPSLPEPALVARSPPGAEASGWSRWLPGLQTLRGYQAGWLRHDIAAGLVLTTMLVPVGIAYAVASGVPKRDSNLPSLSNTESRACMALVIGPCV